MSKKREDYPTICECWVESKLGCPWNYIKYYGDNWKENSMDKEFETKEDMNIKENKEIINDKETTDESLDNTN